MCGYFGMCPGLAALGASIVTMRVRKRGRHMRGGPEAERENAACVSGHVSTRVSGRTSTHAPARTSTHAPARTSARSAHALPDLPAAYPSGIHTELALK